MDSADERIARFLGILRDGITPRLIPSDGVILIMVTPTGVPMMTHTPNIEPTAALAFLVKAAGQYEQEIEDGYGEDRDDDS